MGSDPMVKKFFSHYAPRPWGMQPNTSLAANFPHSPWAFPCSCLCVYHTIFGNFWVNSCDSCGRQVILCFTAPSGLNGVLPHCRKMLITWEGGGVALARCGLDEQREEVELEGPGEAKTWLGESFILAMKRNHSHRQCHRNQRDARLGFCTQRTSVQFVCQPSHVK